MMEARKLVDREMRKKLHEWDQTLAVLQSTVTTDARPDRYRPTLRILQNLREQTECDLKAMSHGDEREWAQTKCHLEDLLEFMALEYSTALEE